MAQPKSPNEKVIRETIEENKELLKMLASNGKSKSNMDRPRPSTD
jgi:hypothetical protein